MWAVDQDDIADGAYVAETWLTIVTDVMDEALPGPPTPERAPDEQVPRSPAPLP